MWLQLTIFLLLFYHYFKTRLLPHSNYILLESLFTIGGLRWFRTISFDLNRYLINKV